MNIKDLLKDAYKDGMTLEEVEAALESIDLPTGNDDLVAENARLKNALTKSNSENAAWKKKMREKETEEERVARERAEKWEKLENDYNELLKAKTISDNKSQLISIGYDESLAEDTAQAMFENNTSKVFANQKKFMENAIKKFKTDLLQNTPKPGANSSENGGIDYKKEAEEAMQSGDFIKASYYTRLAGQMTETNNQ